MKSFRPESISGFFALAAITIAGASSVFLWAIWALSHYADFELQAKNERRAFMEAEKAAVRAEVSGVRDRIIFIRDRVEREERAALKARVDEALSLADGIWRRAGGGEDPRRFRNLLVEGLREVRFGGGRGYYFVVSTNGVSLLNTLRPELEGGSVLDLADGEGRFPFRELVAKASQGGGYVTYSWNKPGKPEGFFPKLAYAAAFAPGGVIIGTGEYQEDIQERQRREAVEQVGAVRFGDTGYVFALAPDSTMLSHRAMPDLVGRRMVEEESPLLRELFPLMVEATAKDGAGFLEYVWPKAGGGLSTKVSYVARIPGWNWILGAGFHLDDLDARVEVGRRELRNQVLAQFGTMSVLFVAVVFISVLFARRFARRIDADLRAFENFFEESAGGASRIRGPLKFAEFRTIARAANRMSEERERIEAEKKVLEARLTVKRNLETIGTLAGGIAHDFNNILAAVIGYAELLERNAEDAGKVRGESRQIMSAALRARDLVQRILAFSTQAPVDKVAVELAPIMDDTLQMARASVPTSVEIVHELDPSVVVEADPTQMSQLLLNLLTNAATAMRESGGVARVTLSKVRLGEDRDHRLADLPEGEYALLTVADTGPGIDPSIRERIFEPFFTTHPGGRGSGLGLSVVHGVAKSHGGAVLVESEPGRGATFSVYLPVSSALPPEKPVLRTDVPARGTESVLFVDDERMLVELARERLGLLGYKVTGFTDPVAALEAFRAAPGSFDILITDMTMPKLTGDNLARAVLAIRPELPVIVSTGFSDAMNPEIARRIGVAALLMKPVTLAAIAARMREILDRRKTAG